MAGRRLRTDAILMFFMVPLHASRFSFRLEFFSLCSLLALLALPFCGHMPASWSYENGALENLQLVLLSYGAFLCLTATGERSFYRCMALVLAILFLREISCGRTWFFAVPGEENTFYKWKEIPYGWVVQLAYRLLILGTIICFLLKKRYLVFWKLGKGYVFPFFPVLELLFSIPVVLCAEHVFEKPMLEEAAELAAYLAGLSLFTSTAVANCLKWGRNAPASRRHCSHGNSPECGGSPLGPFYGEIPPFHFPRDQQRRDSLILRRANFFTERRREEPSASRGSARSGKWI